MPRPTGWSIRRRGHGRTTAITSCKRANSAAPQTPISEGGHHNHLFAGSSDGNRPYSWQASLQVQQDIGRGLAAQLGYFRTWYGNQSVTKNRAVTAADFDPYCVTASTNALLPGGGGNQICWMSTT